MSSDMDLDALADELADFAAPDKKTGRTAREERIVAGFEDIQRFVAQQGRAPRHGADGDIFERLYAVRLERLRAQDDCCALLAPLDHQGLLQGDPYVQAADGAAPDDPDDDALLADLAGMADATQEITTLRHVRSHASVQAAEEVAEREPCADFERFAPLFEQVQQELKSGVRQTRPFVRDASIEAGQFFILGGQTVYVAEVGETLKAPNGENDARLRVVYSNATESNLLRRSLQRALYKDDAGRRITDPDAGPLFADAIDEGDSESGTIYVLRSLSSNPYVAEHRALIHKIGVTGGKVAARIAGAAHDATYLLADVEVVATYKLAGIRRTGLEALLHRIFAPAQLDLAIADRFGHPVKPREWFLVPLQAIDQAVACIRNGSITRMRYDPQRAMLVDR